MLQEQTDIINEGQVDALCKRLEEEYITLKEQALILNELDLLMPAVREKTNPLRRLFARKRIPDFDAWRVEILRNTWALRRIARGRNQGAKLRAEQLRQFRVELHEPSYNNNVPLAFYAYVYVKERYHGSVTCIVTEQDLALLPVTNKSLSKRAQYWTQFG